MYNIYGLRITDYTVNWSKEGKIKGKRIQNFYFDEGLQNYSRPLEAGINVRNQMYGD